ncbi:selenocysteine-specific elongation factor [Campylobacter iguaniorum]|uniref:selenocysteine-specific translation elongation factor n=1 Tax=Campylobacter iguaniorum TaxID=1244531 RepID=UPI00073A395E|nr:selenocysteine-specific translation elongation factor [Campylobacter iguaniorum]ALV25245.1 selenocysteine-specific elongation factor [Campylobacter iguaniorum]
MTNLIIGTSGHIDHGKTALIRALNGFEGDKTKDELERGITIDLSFSHLQNEDTNIAFIDVPGHENLVKTMISGAYGFDACMLVVASNEGIKAQTKEHIEILNLLGVKNIILVITKCDLSSKSEQISLQENIFELIKEYPNLSIYETFFVSIKDENSINELRNYLFTLKPKFHDESTIFRYYIDRVFSLKGHGTIVTGSVISGVLKAGEKILNLDLGETFTVRSIQIHDQNVSIATPPNRVAINLSGNKLDKIQKGQILSKKGFWRRFNQIDAKVSSSLLKHGDEVLFCVGSAQFKAKAVNLKDDFWTFKFSQNVFLQFKEKFIILQNNHAIGGGEVLSSVLEPLKKEQKIELLKALSINDFKMAFLMLAKVHKHGFGLISAVQRFALSTTEALQIAHKLEGLFIDDEIACIYSQDALLDIKKFIEFLIHKNPNALFSPTSINLKLTWASVPLIEVVLNDLEQSKIVQKNGGIYAKFGADFDKLNENVVDQIYNILLKQSFTPDAPYNIYDSLDIDRITGDNALKMLTKSKKIIRLEHNLFISAAALNEVMNLLRNIIKIEGKVNITSAKNHLNLSRKYALAYLEYLDNFADIKKFENDRLFI